MKLICLSSSSKGNGYILSAEGEALVIEAGVPLKAVKKALGWNLRPIRGCVISHSHADHCGHYMDYAKAGINVLAPADVFTIPHNRNHPVVPNQGYKLGGFKVAPLEVPHDATTYAYIIDHDEMGRAVFVTDTYLFEYYVPAVHHWLIECNHEIEIVDAAIEKGYVHSSRRGRIMKSHMDLQTVKEVMTRSDGSKLRNVILLHLSDTSSDEARFIQEITAHTGAAVYAADGGVKIDLSKELF